VAPRRARGIAGGRGSGKERTEEEGGGAAAARELGGRGSAAFWREVRAAPMAAWWRRKVVPRARRAWAAVAARLRARKPGQ